MSTVYREVSRGEFLRRHFATLRRTARGGPSFLYAAKPLAAGGMKSTIRDDRGGVCLTETEAPDLEGVREGRTDQEAAIIILAALADFLLDCAQNQRTLKFRYKILFEQVPRGFSWVVMPEGRHLIRAFNAAYAQPWPPGAWRELAAHPNQYGDIWRVVERQSEDGIGGGTLYIDHPPSLARWAKFEFIDARLGAERDAGVQ